MRKLLCPSSIAAALLLVVGGLFAGDSEVDDDLFATHRVFTNIGPGLRAVRHGADGKYYVLVSPSVGVAVFDSRAKPLSVIGALAATAEKTGGPSITFGEDCDVDGNGNVYVADRGANAVTEFAPDGKVIRSFPVDSLLSLAVLPENEVAVSTLQSTHQVTVYGPNGKVTREFGDFESLSSRADLDRYLNLGRVAADPQGHVYFGFTYMPEPTVREFDRSGAGTQDFVFTGVDAYPEASAQRKAIARQEGNGQPPVFRPILTAFGVDSTKGDLWMCLHNTLVHFDKDGIRRSEYQIYTPKGLPLDGSVISVEQDRLLIGADPLGVYEFLRPDRKR